MDTLTIALLSLFLDVAATGIVFTLAYTLGLYLLTSDHSWLSTVPPAWRRYR